MPKHKKRKNKVAYPGSIYVPTGCNRIYLKYADARSGKYIRLATGLANTPEGWEVAETMLKKIYLRNNAILTSTESERQHRGTSSNIDTLQAVLNGVSCSSAHELFVEHHSTKVSSRTIDSYKDAIHKIIPSPLRQDTISNALIEDCIRKFVTTAKLAPTSINIHLRGFQVFATFCAQQEWIRSHNYYSEFKRQTPGKKIQIFTREEVDKLVGYYRKKKRLDMALFIEFLMATGFRIGQALALRWEDIDDQCIYRLSKDKERNEAFPLTDELKALLAQMPRHATKPNKIFFWETSSQSALTRDLENAMNSCGIEKNGRGWHVFRKTAATRWAEAGMPIQDVQKLLGHTDLKVTNSYYVSVEIDTLKQKLEKISGNSLTVV